LGERFEAVIGNLFETMEMTPEINYPVLAWISGKYTSFQQRGRLRLA